MIKKCSFIFSIIILLYGNLLSMDANADNDNADSISTKEAVILSINEFQRYFGELPSKFELSVENKSKSIEVILILVPYREGGDLTAIVDKKTGKIVKVIKGQ